MGKKIMVQHALHCDVCPRSPMVVWDMPTIYRVWAYLCSDCVGRVGTLSVDNQIVTTLVDARPYKAIVEE